MVRRVEAGEEIIITVSGRPSARLVPARPTSWRTFADLADLFSGAPDSDWERDRDRVDHSIRDPWERQ